MTTMNKVVWAAGLAGALVLAGCATPGSDKGHWICKADAAALAQLEQILAKKALPTPDGLDDKGAACARARLNDALEARYGPPAGYKAGLTNPAVQKRFNATAPVWGALYAPMLLDSGATVDAAFGTRPLFEADLLVRVADVGINQARSAEDVLAHIDAVIPFIELPDLMVDNPAKLNGAVLSAVNVGARLGVMGTPVPVQRTAEFSNGLRDGLIVIAANGAELDRGRGSDVLGHPLNAVVYLTQALAAEGRTLKKGDLLSLGSFSKLMPPKPGQTVDVVYQGLPGTPKVQVTFR
jgi:2-keto-4-pentenoate hydratase